MAIRFVLLFMLYLLVASARPLYAHDMQGRHSAEEMLQFIDGRSIQLLQFTDLIEVPFIYPTRPTLSVSMGGNQYQWLLDSGTRLSVLTLASAEQAPASLHFYPDSHFLADLDSGRPLEYATHTLSYAEAPLLSCSEMRIRNLPIRIYSYVDDAPGSDFQGSLSLRALAGMIVEIDNGSQMMRLHRPDNFVPASRSSAIPLLQLHDLLLVQAGAGEEGLLLALDTGFSGELLLNAAARGRLGSQLELSGKQSPEYLGFHQTGRGAMFRLEQLDIPAESWPGLAANAINLGGLDVYVDQGMHKDTAFGQVDGIIGSGLLSRFNYAVDQQRSVIFLEER